MPIDRTWLWAREYDRDPVTKELLAREVKIPHHDELHEAASGFLDPPFKLSLGKANTELLGMYHYTVHLKMGLAREYLNELEETLRKKGLDPRAEIVFNKLLTGFFTSLMGGFDNLTQVANLVCDLGLREQGDFF